MSMVYKRSFVALLSAAKIGAERMLVLLHLEHCDSLANVTLQLLPAVTHLLVQLSMTGPCLPPRPSMSEGGPSLPH
jgi:hypothetical protein